MPLTTRHRGRRRSRIHKYVWPTVAVLSAASSVKSEGLLSVSGPCESANEWGQNSSTFAPVTDSFRYRASSYPELETIALNPAGAIRLMDNLFLNAGLDAMSPSLALGQYYTLFPSVWGEGFGSHVKADSETWGWGGNIGLVWDMTKHQHLVVTYNSPMDDDYSGRFIMDPMEAAAGAISSGFNSAMRLPTIVGIGYGIALSETISLETDFEWLDFSRYKSSDLNAGNDPILFATAGKSTSTPQNWRNNFASGVGGDWKFAEHWVLRAGYQFFENPMRNSAFSPTTPDANQHVITLGIGWNGKHSSLEVAYALDLYYDRHIANDSQPGFDGSYGFNGHLLSLAYKFSF